MTNKVEVRIEVTPHVYKWVPAEFVQLTHENRVIVRRHGLTCDAGGINPRPSVFNETHKICDVREVRS
jgi:hypothetical protein